MKKSPLFSIVIVNWNHGLFLKECIKSILFQDFKDFELIIIDGGSTDNSLEVIQEFDDGIHYWISEKDSGQSEAFNKGFRISQGEFLLWVNADDILLPGALSVCASVIINNPTCDWIAGNTIFLDSNGQIVKCAKGSRWNDFNNGGCFIPVFGPSSVFRRELLNRVGFFDESLIYSMDTDLWVRFRINGIKFERLNRYIWGFRLHDNSKTAITHSGKRIKKMENEAEVIRARYCNNSSGFLRIMGQRLFRILDLTLLFSFYETIRFRGRHFSEYFKIR